MFSVDVNKRILLLVAALIPVLVIGGILLEQEEEQAPGEQEQTQEPESPTETPIEIEEPDESDFPKIASWLAKKEELIESQKPFDLVMAGWFTPEEAAELRENNSDVIILAGLTTTWVWDNEAGLRRNGIKKKSMQWIQGILSGWSLSPRFMRWY